jgi:hypothetical protein
VGAWEFRCLADGRESCKLMPDRRDGRGRLAGGTVKREQRCTFPRSSSKASEMVRKEGSGEPCTRRRLLRL